MIAITTNVGAIIIRAITRLKRGLAERHWAASIIGSRTTEDHYPFLSVSSRNASTRFRVVTKLDLNA